MNHPQLRGDPRQRPKVGNRERVEDVLAHGPHMHRRGRDHEAVAVVGEMGQGVTAVVRVGDRVTQPRCSKRLTTFDSRDNEPLARKANSLMRIRRAGASEMWLRVRYSNNVRSTCRSGDSSLPGSNSMSETRPVHACFSSWLSQFGSSLRAMNGTLSGRRAEFTLKPSESQPGITSSVKSLSTVVDSPRTK